MALQDYKGAAEALTLASGINGAVTSFTSSETPSAGWATGSYAPFVVTLDKGVAGSEEKVLVTTRSGSSFSSVTRGYDGTSAVAHGTGATITHSVDANSFLRANKAVVNTIEKWTAAGQLLVSTASETGAALANGTAGLPLVAGASTPAYAELGTSGIAAGAVTAAKVAADVATQAELDAHAADTTSVHGVTDMTGLMEAGDAAGGVLDGTYPSPGLAASVAGDGLAETSNVLSVNVDGSTLEISSDSLRAKDAGITLAKLAAAAKAHTFEFSFPGTQATSTGTLAWRAPFAGTLQHVRLYCTTAPTGASLIVDLHKSGTTVYTTQANRPTIAAAANAETATTAPDVTSFSAGDRFTMDRDQVGSSVAGSDLVAVVYYTLA